MSKIKDRSGDDLDSTEIFLDPDLDPESFVEAMEDKRGARSSWKRVEELRDARWLGAQLADWEDWE